MNIGKVCHGTMLSPIGSNLETQGLIGKCKDFLCPPEHFIRETFQTSVAGKLRAKALDPYGTMVAQIYGKTKGSGNIATWKCRSENCHAKIMLRTVKSDNEGNLYGLFGCFSHQHEMPRQNKSRIVFKNRMECQEFYDKNLLMLYGKGQKGKTSRYFPCRRRGLGFNKKTGTRNPNCGYIDCTSTFIMSPVFKLDTKDLQLVPLDERPYCILGVFFHNHENDERFHRLDGTGLGKINYNTGAPRKWKIYNSSPSTPKIEKQIKRYYIPKKKRLELGIESNFKSKVLCDFSAASGKIRGKPKQSKTKSIPQLLQMEMLETKEAQETVETDIGLESNIKVRGKRKKIQ